MVAHNKAFDMYLETVSELAETAGLMAHAEFEFLYNSRQSFLETRQQLNQHTAQHGC